MAKTDTQETTANETAMQVPAVETVAEQAEFPLTLEEFCIRLSVNDSRVELIGGFERQERLAGRVKDVESNFAGRFQAFTNQPA